MSDGRIKDNIRTIEDGYETIKRMRPVEYNCKNTLERQSYGFIAQEILEIKPNCRKTQKNISRWVKKISRWVTNIFPPKKS